MKETQEAPVSRRNLGIIRLGIVAKPMCKSLIGAGYPSPCGDIAGRGSRNALDMGP